MNQKMMGEIRQTLRKPIIIAIKSYTGKAIKIVVQFSCSTQQFIIVESIYVITYPKANFGCDFML